MESKAGHEKLELYVSCKNLKTLTGTKVVNPQIKFYIKHKNHWKLHAESEIIKDNENPYFTRTFIVDYMFEQQQPVKFDIYDFDDKIGKPMGSAETTIGAIIGGQKQTLTLDVLDKQIRLFGGLIVTGIKVGGSPDMIVWQWSADKLKNSKADLFLRFFKVREGLPNLLVHETECVKKNATPLWKLFELSVDKLVDGNHSRKFAVEAWDYLADKKYKLIGKAELTLDQIKHGQDVFPLHEAKAGRVGALNVKLHPFKLGKPTLLDFIRGGEKLNLVSAVDFTESNGHINEADSLHADKGYGQLNEYQRALKNVGEILMNYDHEKHIAMYGFGGIPLNQENHSHEVSHCFPLNGSAAKPFVTGVRGMLDQYWKSLQAVELSGPTHFSPIIKQVFKQCELNKNTKAEVYTTLLIITDGQIMDMKETRDLIVKAATLPLSIIIVGVGKANFKKMEILNSDHGKLKDSNGIETVRDCVQFVPFASFNDDMRALSEHVLSEIPSQFLNYAQLEGRQPHKSF